MSIDGSLDSKPTIIGNRNGNGIAAVSPAPPLRLRVSPNSEHKPDKYDDMETEMEEFSPLLHSSLERFLPNSMLSETREVKAKYMREMMLKYFPRGERTRAQKHKAYRDKISHYEPLHTELYSVLATNFFVPSFLMAITDNSEDSFRSIMSEPTPGVFTFEMFQPRFCDVLLSEVENFEQWVFERKLWIMQPNAMNKYGVVLDDFGLEAMLGKLLDDYIRPLSKVFYSEVGGSTLDSHHGFVVEYGIGRDIDLTFHVDDSEVTLNVCLSKQFVGGELFFRGVRCEMHVNTETLPEEIFDYFHVRGHAILHRGRHRHGARATTGGNRTNLILWCRSSVFRELKKYQKDFSSWCGECQREKKERQQSTVAATKQELLKMDGETNT